MFSLKIPGVSSFGSKFDFERYTGLVDYCENCRRPSEHKIQRSRVRSIYSGFKSEPYSIKRCKLCKYSYTFPKLSQEQLNVIYEDTYAYGVHAALEGELRV